MIPQSPLPSLIPAAVSLSGVSSILFLLALVVTAGVGAMLYYHWIRYGVGIMGTITVMIVYTVGVAVFLLAALGLLTQL